MDRQKRRRRDDARSPVHEARAASLHSVVEHWAVACWVFILAAIGVVQIVRLQWFDTAVFAVAVLGVVLIARTTRPRRTPWRIGVPALAGTTAALGAVLCFLPRHSLVMQIVVVAAGLAAAVLAWSGAAVAQPERQTSAGTGIRRLAWAWGAILIAGCLWELTQFILGLVQPDAAWFSLSDLLNPAVATVPGKIVFVMLWLTGGAWLLRRGGAR